MNARKMQSINPQRVQNSIIELIIQTSQNSRSIYAASSHRNEEDGSPGLVHMLQRQSPVVLETKHHSLTDLCKL